jgi:3-oxoacyl-[acyl-carrier protein] reductase
MIQMSRVILITGASKGIGMETCKRFFYEDNDITNFILLARDSDSFQALLKELNENNPFSKKVKEYFIDLSDRESLLRVIDNINIEYDNIDLLINNAGYTKPESLQQISFDDFERTMQVNLYAPFTIIQKMLQSGNKFEFIVNIASTAGIKGRSGWLTYAASKAALINMTEVMKAELSIFGTRVACISPGRCATGLRKILAPDEDPTTIMQPEHVANVIGMLFSDVGCFIDSENLVVRL